MKFAPAVLCALAAHAFPTGAIGQEIRYPAQTLVDDPRPIVVVGLSPGEEVTLRTHVVDGAGVPWIGTAEFTADAAGSVDTGRDAPTAGVYTGVQPAALFNHMVPESDAPVRFLSTGLTMLRTSLTLVRESGALDSLVLDRALWDPGIEVNLRNDRLLERGLFERMAWLPPWH